MNADEYAKLDAVELAKLLRSRQIAPEEPARCAVEMIERHDPAIGAVIDVYRERVARDFVEAAPKGPLWGVPFLFKDLGCHEDDQIVEAGSRLTEGLRHPGETVLASRFRSAGLINLGRSKTPEIGFNISTENVLHGPTRNPWRLDRSAGGSSGGAAAAVIAGYVPMAHASDGAGSIRIPAACCGVVGLKTSRGRVSMGPVAAEGLNGLGSDFVVSRSVRDSAFALDQVGGYSPGDPFKIEQPRQSYLSCTRVDPPPLKVAVWTKAPDGSAPAAEVADALEAAAGLLQGLGHHVSAAPADIGVDWDRFVEGNAAIWCSNIALWVSQMEGLLGRKASLEYLEPATFACYRYGKALAATDLLGAFDVLNTVSRTLGAEFAAFDLILSPTLPTPAPPLGTYDATRIDLDGLGWTRLLFDGTPFTPAFNCAGLPAVSLPMGWSDSEALPIGIQLAANAGREDLLLAVAAQIERSSPWRQWHAPVGALAASHV